MSFRIRPLMIKLAPGETERLTIPPTDRSEACMPKTFCCGGCETSQQKDIPYSPVGGEDAGDENPGRVTPREGLAGLGSLRQQLRQTLNH